GLRYFHVTGVQTCALPICAAGASVVRRAADPDRARRADEERAVPVPFLAAAGDDRADAGLGVPAFGDDGQGRRVPARAALARARRNEPPVLDQRYRRRVVAASRLVLRYLSSWCDRLS